MKKLNLVLSFCIFIALCKTSDAQILYKYGMRLGINQSHIESEYLFSRDVPGFYGFLNAEKKLLPFLSFRPEVGYVQNNSDAVPFGKYSYKTHNLALNLDFKIHPFRTKIKPYLILGLQGSCFLGYNTVWDDEAKLYYPYLIEDMRTIFDHRNKFLLSGIFGFGIEIYSYISLDIEYYPTFTKIYKGEDMTVKGGYFGLTLGVNISNFFSKK